jgi:hypothetical protein
MQLGSDNSLSLFSPLTGLPSIILSPSGTTSFSNSVSISGNLNTTGSFNPSGAVNLLAGQSVTFLNNGNSVSMTSPAGDRLQFNVSGNSFEARPGGLMFPAGNRIMDQNGQTLLGFGYSGTGAINYLQVDNAATGQAATLRAAGADANVDINLSPKGTGNTLITSGNVGIGTAPSGKLHVVQGVAPTIFARNTGEQRVTITTDAVSNRIDAFSPSGAPKDFELATGGTAPRSIGFNPAGSRAVTITPSGNVGIGTAQPTHALTLYSPIATQNLTGSERTYATLGFQVSPSNYVPASIAAVQPNNYYQDAADLVFSTGAGVGFGERMRIRANGNVGIGSTVPTEKLEVVGNVKISGTLAVGGQSVATANQLSSYATTAQLATYQPATGSGAGLTGLNATQLTTGVVSSARGGAGMVNGMLKADGAGAVSQAVAGADYVAGWTDLSGVVMSTSSPTHPSSITLVGSDGVTLTGPTTGNDTAYTIHLPGADGTLLVDSDVTTSSAPGKIIKLNSKGLIDPSVLRIPPAGDLLMGSFTAGTDPEE